MDKNERPIGLNFALSMNKEAMNYYSTLNLSQQKYINDYIENSNYIDKRVVIDDVIKQLEEKNEQIIKKY